MKKICFIVPGITQSPAGGTKMIFEYANRLVNRGYYVKILFWNDISLERYHLPEFIRRKICNSLTNRGVSWFNLDRKIEKISLYDKKLLNKISDTEVVVFSAVETVYLSNNLFPSKVKKIYFIQDYENWNHSDDYVTATFQMGFDNVVISEWLKKIVDKYSTKPSVVIKNPIDINIYRPICSIKSRKPHSISVLFHKSEHKGFIFAFRTIQKLKQMYPDLEVHAFGGFPKPDYFPSYFSYCEKATQKETVSIYNSTSVFLCASIKEGYGLTGLEAMACGTALVSTEYEGVLEYAQDGYNALLSPIRDVDILVNNVKRLFDNDDLRIKIAENGVHSVESNFKWDDAVSKFCEVIEN